MFTKRMMAVTVGVLAALVIASPCASAAEAPSVDKNTSTHDTSPTSDEGSGEGSDDGAGQGSGDSSSSEPDRPTTDRTSATTCNFNSINTAPNDLHDSNGNTIYNAPYDGGNVSNQANCLQGS